MTEVAMPFAAYESRRDGTDFSYEGRNPAAGIRGIYKPGSTPPVATASTLEELARKAREHLGKEPAAFLYLTDHNNDVHQIMMNEKYYEAIQKANRHTAIAVSLLIHCMTSLFAASSGSLGAWALVFFVGAAALYALSLRTEFFNEVEGAFICEIVLVLALLLVPAINKIRNASVKTDATAYLRRISADTCQSSSEQAELVEF